MSNTFSGLVRIGSDPEIRTIPNGSQVLSFSAANSIGFGDRQKTLWLRVSYWRNPDKLINFIKKGQQIVISGELSQNEYQANDGTTKTSLELNANVVDLVGSMYQSGNNGSNAKPPVQAQMQTQAQAKAQAQAQAQAYGHNQNQNKALDDYQDVPF